MLHEECVNENTELQLIKYDNNSQCINFFNQLNFLPIFMYFDGAIHRLHSHVKLYTPLQ